MMVTSNNFELFRVDIGCDFNRAGCYSKIQSGACKTHALLALNAPLNKKSIILRVLLL